MNGRSFQSLMTLTPGVLIVPSQGVGQSGELSVNGQRTEANYFTVDGVSAHIGASVSSSGFTNDPPMAKQALLQNNFGGTFGDFINRVYSSLVRGE